MRKVEQIESEPKKKYNEVCIINFKVKNEKKRVQERPNVTDINENMAINH